MQVILYRNTGQYNLVDKRGSLAYVGGFDCQIKHPSTLLRPVVTMARESVGDLATVNYAYIPEFSRYYFAKLSVEEAGIVTVTCEVDPLTSWANQIMGIHCTVARNEFNYNMDLPDPDIPVLAGRNVTYRNFTSTPFSPNPQGRHYVLTVTGSEYVKPTEGG